MITERYRKDYTGEFIVTNSAWAGGKKRMTREWIPNTIENNHISNRAACIGSAADRATFDFRILETHKGGLLGSLKLQTYGVGDVSGILRLDFIIEKDEQKLQNLINVHRYANNVIYTSPRMCLKHPGVFHPVPFNPLFAQPMVLPYLAAFDGHKEVFLLGYTGADVIGQSEWVTQLRSIMTAYTGTKFYLVGAEHQVPTELKEFANFEHLTYREFVIHCDI